MNEMSTPTGTPGTPDNANDNPDDRTVEQQKESVDPTRTVDAYFEKSPPTLKKGVPPTEALPETESASLNQHETAYGSDDYSDFDNDSRAHDPQSENDSALGASDSGTRVITSGETSGYGQPVHPDPHPGPHPGPIPESAWSQPVAPPTMTDTAVPVETAEPARVVRMRTVVFGLVLLVIAGAVLVGQLTDVTVDAGAVLLALMIGGGLLLIAGARRS
jgi:hypothetical protein